MTFVTSNLYGDMSRWQRLLQAVSFSDRDVMYVLGDTVDFGEQSMELLTDMSMRVNVLPIAGNHDLLALRMLTAFDKLLQNGDSPSPEFAAAMREWLADGGAPTLEGFRALDADMREGVLDYLAEFTLFEEVEAGGRHFVLTHAGIADFKATTPLDDYPPEAFLSEGEHALPHLVGKVLVAGDTATDNEKINIMDGLVCLGNKTRTDGTVACLCLENGREYYV